MVVPEGSAEMGVVPNMLKGEGALKSTVAYKPSANWGLEVPEPLPKVTKSIVPSPLKSPAAIVSGAESKPRLKAIPAADEIASIDPRLRVQPATRGQIAFEYARKLVPDGRSNAVTKSVGYETLLVERPLSMIELANASEVVGAATENNTEFEYPPPGAGFDAVTKARFAVAISEAGMPAFNCEALTKVVARALPFHRIVAPLTNPAPFTVSVNAGPPGTTAPGTVGLFKNGTGLFCAASCGQKAAKMMMNCAASMILRTGASPSAGREARSNRPSRIREKSEECKQSNIARISLARIVTQSSHGRLPRFNDLLGEPCKTHSGFTIGAGYFPSA